MLLPSLDNMLTAEFRPGVPRPLLGGALLAAGLGRRLEPLTVRYLPKPMFPLGGQVPLIETWVRKLRQLGVERLSMNLCVHKPAIRDYFGDGRQCGVQLSYLEEDTPSGTLGGVCRQVLGSAAHQLPGESMVPLPPFAGDTVLVPSGDIVTNFGVEQLAELYALHRQAGAAVTMVLVPIPAERRRDFGTAVLRETRAASGRLGAAGPIVAFHEKDPHSPSIWNNASIYLIETRLLRELDAQRTPAQCDVERPFYDFGKHVFPALLGKSPVVCLDRNSVLWGVQYDGPWFDVGQKSDYLQVNREVLDGRLAVDLPWERQAWGYLGQDVTANWQRVTIIPPVVIGDRCVIADGATIGPYAILGSDWTVEENARVAHAVLWERYPLFLENGERLSVGDMRALDRHEIAAGVVVEQAIVTGGRLEHDVREATVELLPDGRISCRPLTYQPDGARA